MLDFILSKLNLLILVTAIFAIISFFALGLTEISKVKIASEEVSRVKEQSFALVSSPSYCFSGAYSLPDRLSIAGSSFYYVLGISKREITTKDGTVNTLIFSIYPREEVKKRFQENSTYVAKAIAADSFRTKADIRLYSELYHGSYYDGGIFNAGDLGADDLWVDPQAVVPVNRVEFVKEIQGGKATLYVIACNSALCPARKSELGKRMHPPTLTEQGEFPC